MRAQHRTIVGTLDWIAKWTVHLWTLHGTDMWTMHWSAVRTLHGITEGTVHWIVNRAIHWIVHVIRAGHGDVVDGAILEGMMIAHPMMLLMAHSMVVVVRVIVVVVWVVVKGLRTRAGTIGVELLHGYIEWRSPLVPEIAAWHG